MSSGLRRKWLPDWVSTILAKLMPWGLMGVLFRMARNESSWLVRTIARAMLNVGANTTLMSHPFFRQQLVERSKTNRPAVKWRRKGCAQLVVLFGGLDAYMGADGYLAGVPPLEFFRESGLLGRNLLWLRDPHADNFSQGIGAEAPSVNALAEWILEQVRAMPHVRELYAVGYSSGSHAAILFGHLCKMQTVFAFSPRTSHPEGHEQAMKELEDLLSTHNGVTRYRLMYAAKNRADAEFATRVAHYPGVTIQTFEQYGGDHALIALLAESGELRAILPPYVAASDAAANHHVQVDRAPAG